MARRTDPDQDYDDNGYDGPSKSQVKREMLELQALGPALLELPAAQFEALELDERLREALEELRRLKIHGARKRQLQYVGKLMRNTDPEPLRRAVDAWQASRTLGRREHDNIERWRERLLADDKTIAEWLALHPRTDTPKLRAQIRDARRELAAGAHGRASRELFRYLREALLTAGT